MNGILFIVLAAVMSAPSAADQSLTAKRDQAIQRIETCRQHNDTGRKCKNLNNDIQSLIDVYHAGDKSVLPTLFLFTYLRDFYDEALLGDPEGFLKAMSQLPDDSQRSVAIGLSGGMFRLPRKERFEAIRAVLQAVADQSPTYKTAQLSLKVLDSTNAMYLVSYFPPQTLTGRTAGFEMMSFSSAMYALGEQPLWPPSSKNEKIYRLNYFGSFNGSAAITLTLQADGTGIITARKLIKKPAKVEFDESVTLPADGAQKFFTAMDQAHFWSMPTESPSHGLDGAEWILEGVQDGKYHMVHRWCPGEYDHSPDDAAFARAARMLFELAGHKHNGSC